MGRYPYYLVWAVRSFPGEELIRALYAGTGQQERNSRQAKRLDV